MNISEALDILGRYCVRLVPQQFKRGRLPRFRRIVKRWYKIGRQRGYTDGLEAGRSIWLVKDLRCARSPQAIEFSLYGPAKFNVTDAMREQMRQDVAIAVAKGIVDDPTPAQWDMILSESPSTCIIAGAGSGKSTTLILRTVFMLGYLKIPLREMTVVSFTRTSCSDVRQALRKILPSWNIHLSEVEAESLVRTFHSAVHRIARSVFENVQFFENLGRLDRRNRFKEADEEDIENPFASNLSTKQTDFLRETYSSLFNSDPKFKSSVTEMLNIVCARDLSGANEEYKRWTLERASKRDAALVRMVNARFKEKGYWPPRGVIEGPLPAFSTEGFRFNCNGKIESTGEPFFLGGQLSGANIFDEDEQVFADEINEANFGIYESLKVKRNVVSTFCGVKFLYCNSSQSLEKLRWLAADSVHRAVGENTDAPIFKIKLGGEFGYSQIYEALYTQAAFIEALGLDVLETVPRLDPFLSDCVEYHFCQALTSYWQYFTRDLAGRGMMTYNRAFRLLASGDKAALSPEMLRPIQHLLIDEFQDISPQIVRWLTASQRTLLAEEKPGQFVSIMAVGDDWQSIYGWRGSAPEFFINFDRHFPSHPKLGGKAAVIRMAENFRSVEPIVRQAEILLEPIKHKLSKNTKSMRPSDPGDHGIYICECGEYDERCIKAIARFAVEQFRATTAMRKPHRNRVMVMARSNDILNRIQQVVGTVEGIKFHTYHSSKGLQAEIAIMVEDSVSQQGHKLRNRIFAASGLFDRAAMLEPQRLGPESPSTGSVIRLWASRPQAFCWAEGKPICIRLWARIPQPSCKIAKRTRLV